LRGEGLLETVRRDKSFADVSGLRCLRDWINKRKSALTPEGQKFGLQPPKGILITGVQGCGKSLAARAVAGEWGYELARLDAGALYDKFVGESEKKLRKALDLAQKMAPMVLWIDEIEKAFASAGTSGDAGDRFPPHSPKRPRRPRPLPPLASHVAHVDAGSRRRRIPGRTQQQHHCPA